MKKNINVIQINGIRGLITAGFIVTCLVAGFIAFPGLVCMKLWNIAASYSFQVPAIGLIQGILLWGIIVACYFLFRKNKLIVCLKSPKGLSDEELKEVFENIKKQAQDDIALRPILKANELDLNNIKPSNNDTEKEVLVSEEQDNK